MPKRTTTITDPVRLHVVKQICEAFREITPGNGYAIDLSGAEGSEDNRVFRGRTLFGSNDPLPAVSVLESPIPLDQLPSPKDAAESFGPWELVVQGFFEDDKDNPCDRAYEGVAAVKKRLALEKKKANFAGSAENGIFGLGRAITNISIGQGVVRPPDEISATAYFWLTLALDIAEDLEEPYEV